MGLALVPLTPEFDASQHQVYVDLLNSAIVDPKVRNVALTGRYGSGKSSVLEQFSAQHAKKQRIVALSLSSLGPEQPDQEKGDQPSQKTSTTNRIQKELVKQLLHRERPSRLRQSRYQRIEVLSGRRAILEAGVIVISVAMVLWAFGWFPSVPGASDHHALTIRLAAILAVAIAPVAVIAWLRLALHDRFWISELSTAGAKISLTKTGSYFDEYLDEIVYFFETSTSVDLVVFEDLDRFDDPGIFEALRELNTLLNNSKQIDTRTIRFIYALRDSVFESLAGGVEGQSTDAAHVEVTRANRTKFFDLVIPIVPFITHRNARDLLTRLLQANGPAATIRITPELIDLTARHIPDMRLLTNICNEYAVFAQSLIIEKKGLKSLRGDQLFALIVYKNIHLSDFENMLLGRSNLDDLYRLSRLLVAEAMAVRRGQLRGLTDEVALPRARATTAEQWGNQLAWYVEQIRQAQSLQGGAVVLSGYEVNGTPFDADRVTDVGFWRAVVSGGAGVVVKFLGQHQPSDYVIDIEGIRHLLPQLTVRDWDGLASTDLARRRAQLESEIEILRTADFVDLAAHPQFVITLEDEAHSFTDLLASEVRSGLGRALISSGFIDRYYTLYAAQYYGLRVSPNVMNFIVQNVDANCADVNYVLSDAEIEALITETRGSFLSERSAYNISIVDYLFRHNEVGAREVLDALVYRVGAEELAFLNAYFVEGRHTHDATSYLASSWPRMLRYLTVDADLSWVSRLDLVSTALANGPLDTERDSRDAVRQFLQDNHRALGVLAERTSPDDKFTDEQVRNAVGALERLGIVFEDLSGLDPVVVARVAEGRSYKFSAANLAAILGENASLSLDSIRAINGDVYNECLQNPEQYLAAFSEARLKVVQHEGFNVEIKQGADWTIEDPATFANIVTDFTECTGDVSVSVLTLAHPDCEVEELADVPTEAWQALAETQRFSLTLPNVDVYLKRFGKVDSGLAGALVSARLIEVPSAEAGEGETDVAAEAKSRVATAVLKAREVFPDAASRVRVATSIGLGEWFALDNVEPEEGPLLGHLVAARIWSNEKALLEHFGDIEWETLAFAIGNSSTFAEYVSPSLLDTSMAPELLNSATIDDGVKRAILSRFDEFIDVASPGALEAAGAAALATGTVLEVASIALIASRSKNARLVVRLLAAHGKSADAGQLVSTLVQLPPPYNQLRQSGLHLRFPRDAYHEAVFRRLHTAGLVKMTSHKAANRTPRIEVIVR